MEVGITSAPADDQSPAQTYLELYFLKKDPRACQQQEVFDAMISDPKPGRVDWWCATHSSWRRGLVRMYIATATEVSRLLEHDVVGPTTFFLIETPDSITAMQKYIDKPDANGKKVFWSRGNGWSVGGTGARVGIPAQRQSSFHRFPEML